MQITWEEMEQQEEDYALAHLVDADYCTTSTGRTIPISGLKRAVAKMQQKLIVYETVLKEYADKENWSSGDSPGVAYQWLGDPDSNGYSNDGFRLAQEALKRE